MLTTPVIGFVLYHKGRSVPDVESITLPSLKYVPCNNPGEPPMKATLSNILIHWRAITDENIVYIVPNEYDFEIRAVVQSYDTAVGDFNKKSVKICVHCTPEVVDFGKIMPAKGMGTTTSYNVSSFNMQVEQMEALNLCKEYGLCIQGVPILDMKEERH